MMVRDENRATIRLGNRQRTWWFHRVEQEIILWDAGQGHSFSLPSAEPESGEGLDSSSLLSPMSGRVVAVLLETGTVVQKGDKVVIIEAMKMEHPVVAGCDGSVELYCSVGEQVQSKQILGIIGE